MEYPTYIEVPEDYWTISTTADNFEENPNKHWHHGEDD